MKLLQQLTIPQVLLLVGFFIWSPVICTVCSFCIWIISLCVSEDVEDEGRYISIGICSCVLILVLSIMKGTWHWLPWIAFTATLTWCFGKRIQRDTEDSDRNQRAISGQIMTVNSENEEQDEYLNWIPVEDEYYTFEYKNRKRISGDQKKRLHNTRRYIEGPKNRF